MWGLDYGCGPGPTLNLMLEEQGMQVIRPTNEELNAFREQGQPAYLEWLAEQGIEQEWVDMALEDAGMSDLGK